MIRHETVSNPPLPLLVLFGVAVGLAALRLAEMPNRWVIAAVAGLWITAGALMAGRPRRAALVIFVFSLQIGLALYLTKPLPASWVGASWPNSLALPLSLLTALGALAAGRTRPFVWGGGIALCAGLLALTTTVSVAGSPVRFIGVAHLVLLLAYFTVFLSAANAVQDPNDLELVRRTLLASLFLQSAIYFIQSLLGGTFTPAGEWIEPADAALGRFGGTVGTRPAVFSSFLLPLLLLAVSDLLGAVEWRVWWRYGLLVAAGCAALMLTFTRASWIAFALGLIYLLVAGARRRMVAGRNVWVLLVLLVMVGATLSPHVWRRVSQDHSAAFDERWALVQMAWRVIQANPVAGVGAGAYPFVFRDYLTPELADRWLFVVHNVYVLRAAETGLPGLAAWLIFLWMAFRRATPERMFDPVARRMALGWRAGLIALGWEMLWDVSLGPPANALLWFLCGLMVAAARLPLPANAAGFRVTAI